MPDTTPSGLHPAYPTREQLQEEDAIDFLVASQCAAAMQLADVLTAAIAQIRSIEFPLNEPAQGYEQDDIISLLHDMTPNLRTMIRRWREAARERVREAV